MQVSKDYIKNNILGAAKMLFLQKGYSQVSMREIAEHGGVGLSNIYNYFKSKNDIFLCVVQPALSAFKLFMRGHHPPRDVVLRGGHTADFLHYVIREYSELLQMCRTEMTILLFKAHGSSLQNFKSDFTHDAAVEMRRLLNEQCKGTDKNENSVSDFTLHLHLLWEFTLLEEIIKNGVNRDELETTFEEYVRYESQGWTLPHQDMS